MTEHADAHPFTPHDALTALNEATRFEEPLRQRTEGLTWMVWGLVSPAIFLMYALLDHALGGAWPWWTQFAWTPWVAAGVLTTVTLWRSAALSAPRLVEDAPSGFLVAGAWIAAVAVAWLVALASPAVHPSVYFLLWLGSAWTLFGAINLYRCSVTGRRVALAIGGLTLAGGVALAFTATSGLAPSAGAALVSGLVPLAGGAWQALRG